MRGGAVEAQPHGAGKAEPEHPQGSQSLYQRLGSLRGGCNSCGGEVPGHPPKISPGEILQIFHGIYVDGAVQRRGGYLGSFAENHRMAPLFSFPELSRPLKGPPAGKLALFADLHRLVQLYRSWREGECKLFQSLVEKLSELFRISLHKKVLAARAGPLLPEADVESKPLSGLPEGGFIQPRGHHPEADFRAKGEKLRLGSQAVFVLPHRLLPSKEKNAVEGLFYQICYLPVGVSPVGEGQV